MSPVKLHYCVYQHLWWRPGLALWAQADTEKLLRSPLGLRMLPEPILSVQDFRAAAPLCSWDPPASVLVLCKHFPLLVFQVASWSGVDIPLSAFPFFTITLFYTNNRLLCCCPLNLENKNPTLQMPGVGDGCSSTKSQPGPLQDMHTWNSPLRMVLSLIYTIVGSSWTLHNSFLNCF